MGFGLWGPGPWVEGVECIFGRVDSLKLMNEHILQDESASSRSEGQETFMSYMLLNQLVCAVHLANGPLCHHKWTTLQSVPS